MAKNIIFYFTGTGNSLKAARDIAATLVDCEIVSIPAYTNRIIPEGYERIGFVFPVYASGLPAAVERFLNESDFSACHNAYYFTVATCGAMSGNSRYDVRRILKDKGISLDAAFSIRMFANYVAMYNMMKDGTATHERAQKAIAAAAGQIARKERTRLPVAPNPLFILLHKNAKGFAGKDEGFTVSSSCASCGQCAALCPVGNITMTGGRPGFNHRCEQCMACIQLCPRRAIDYKDKTQKRRRYKNPDVKIEDLKQPKA